MNATQATFATHIRWMIHRDMPGVLEAEALSFAQPWTGEDFLATLRCRNVIGMVAEGRDDVIHGFMLYELHKARLHVLNFCVHPLSRRLGVGRALAGKLQSKLRYGRRDKISLDVRETNVAAQLFWRAMGFRAVAVIPGPYEGTPEAAYRFLYLHEGE